MGKRKNRGKKKRASKKDSLSIDDYWPSEPAKSSKDDVLFIASDSFMPMTKIGRFCSIGQNVRTCLGRHPTSKYVSTHPSFWLKSKLSGFTFVNENKFEPHLYIDSTNKYIVGIGNDVWIGNNVLLMAYVHVAHDCSIGDHFRVS